MTTTVRTSGTGTSPRISDRVGAIAESLTLSLDTEAKALEAQGRPVIIYGAGEPDFPTPVYIIEAAVAACAVPGNHRYTPSAASPSCAPRRGQDPRDSGYEVEPDQVLVTNGGKQAIYEAFATLLDPGRRGLLPAPFWTTYPESIMLAGGVPVSGRRRVHRLPGHRRAAGGGPHRAHQGAAVHLAVQPDRRGLPARAGRGDRPLGPRARHLGGHRRDLRAPGLRRRRVASMPVVVPELADRCVVLNGVAKTYAMTGWRVGWMIGPTDVIKAATNLQSTPRNVSNVAQRAALAAVSGDLSAVALHARGLRSAPAHHRLSCSVRCPGWAGRTGGRLLHLPVGRGMLGTQMRGRRPPRRWNSPS